MSVEPTLPGQPRGWPDRPVYIMAVKAVVEPADASAAGPELEAELLAFCRAHLSHIKCPRTVDFEAKLPRHPTGKRYKRLLKERYWDKQG